MLKRHHPDCQRASRSGYHATAKRLFEPTTELARSPLHSAQYRASLRPGASRPVARTFNVGKVRSILFREPIAHRPEGERDGFSRARWADCDKVSPQLCIIPKTLPPDQLDVGRS